MYNFVVEIYNFIKQIMTALGAVSDLPTGWNNWLNKNVFYENSLIGLNITYAELIYYVGTLFLVVFLIALFVRFVFYIIKWVGGFLSD